MRIIEELAEGYTKELGTRISPASRPASAPRKVYLAP
jgi:hypothetical protein